MARVSRSLTSLSCAVVWLSLVEPPATAAMPGVVSVDCGRGKTIAEALKHAQPGLVIELNGICTEDVVITTDGITLRGADPLSDGIRGAASAPPAAFGVVRVEGARDVRIENLSILDGMGSGLVANESRNATIVNCRFVNNARDGLSGNAGSFVTITDSLFENNGRSGLAGFGGDLNRCTRCTILGSSSAVLGVATRFSVVDSSLSGTDAAILTETGALVDGRGSSVGSPAVAVRANGASQVIARDSSLNGSLLIDRESVLVLVRSSQTGARANTFDTGSTVRLQGTTTIAGPVNVTGFSQLIVETGGGVSGSLSCSVGGNAHCPDPATQVTGTSNCGLCPKS